MKSARPTPVRLIVVSARGSGGEVLAQALARHSQLAVLELADDGRAAALEAIAHGFERTAQSAPAALAVHAPGAGEMIEELAHMNPEATVVHLVRDGREVALRRARSQRASWGLRVWARQWLAEVAPVLRFASVHPERVVTLAYEDLVADPQEALSRVCLAAALSDESEQIAAGVDSSAAGPPFSPADLDDWHVAELEPEVQPLVSLLGYRVAGCGDAEAAMRARAGAYETLSAEAGAMRERLAEHERLEARLDRLQAQAQTVGTLNAEGSTDDELAAAVAQIEHELVSVRRQAKKYEDALDELAQLRFRCREQPDLLGAELQTLRWKAKRYDQIRAAASPLLRLRRLRAGR